MGELLEALKADFEGHERLRAAAAEQGRQNTATTTITPTR